MSFPIDKVYATLEEEFPKWHVPIIELVEAQTKDPFKILLATILSARTKDATTAQATKQLFKKVNTLADLEHISLDELTKLIYPVGFYKVKAKHLKQLPQVLQEKFAGVLPLTVEELILLPGVGRKTANLVVAVGFKKPAICVDIHMHRINNRFGYVQTKTPYETEMALRKKLPLQYWISYNTYIVAFGQKICTPLSPHCSNCPVAPYCKKVGVVKNR
jgi:endonuclease III